jgi:hypothetical protein
VGVEYDSTHYLPRHYMEVSGHVHFPASSLGMASSCCALDFRADRVAVKIREISCSWLESNYDISVVRPVD